MLTFAAMSPLLSAEELESLHPVSLICQKKSRPGGKKFAKNDETSSDGGVGVLVGNLSNGSPLLTIVRSFFFL
jgi:hypothetical protein